MPSKKSRKVARTGGRQGDPEGGRSPVAVVIDLWVLITAALAVVVLVVAWPHRPAGGVADLLDWLKAGAPWVALAGAAVTAVVQVWRARRARARRERERVEQKVKGVLLGVVGPEELARARVSAWDGTSPLGIQMKLPPAWLDEHPAAERRLRESLRSVTGSRWSQTDRREGRAGVHPVDVVTWSLAPDLTPAQEAREQATERVETIVRKSLQSTRTVAVSDWDASGNPARIKVTYRPVPGLVSTTRQRAIETVIGATLEGRWRGLWDTENDRVTFELRPGLPDLIRRPRDLPTPASVTIRYAVDEDGEYIAWKLEGSSPHALVVGPTGGGKTYQIRAMILDALDQGVEVYGCDPKRIELNGLDELPGVAEIATSAEAIADLIYRIHALMEHRYELIEKRQVQRGELRPVLLVLDEFFILVMRLNRLWQQMEDTKGKEHPAIGLVWELLALARSARIHLAVGIQRPDAAFVDGPARDNLRHRSSLSSLSPDGARMMWQDVSVGIDLPPVPGRATATGADGRPREAQTFLVPDPDPHKRDQWSEDDRADLAAIFGDEWVDNPVKGPETHEVDVLDPRPTKVVVEGEVVDCQAMTDEEELEESGTSPEPPRGDAELLGEARELVETIGYASTAMLGRKLRVGRVVSARLLTLLAEEGVIVAEGDRYVLAVTAAPADEVTRNDEPAAGAPPAGEPAAAPDPGRSPQEKPAPEDKAGSARAVGATDDLEAPASDEGEPVQGAGTDPEVRSITSGRPRQTKKLGAKANWSPAPAEELVPGEWVRMDGRTYRVVDQDDDPDDEDLVCLTLDGPDGEEAVAMDRYETVARAS